MLTALMLGLILATYPLDSLNSQVTSNNDITVSLDTLTEKGKIKPDVYRDSIPVFTLKGIVVTATRTPLAQLAAPASVSIISADSIDHAHGAVAAFLQIPGANVGLTGGLGSVATFSIRGSSTEQVLFLLNGMPLNSALLGGYDLNKISDNINRIEIVKGPASSLYGANALAGVVNIITAVNEYERPYSKITYQYGKHKQQTMSAVLSRQLNRFLSISLAADWKGTDGERPNSDYNGSNYLLGTTLKPDSLIKIGLEYQSYQSISGSPGSLIYGATLYDRMSDDQQDFNAYIAYSDLLKLKAGQSQLTNSFYYGDYGTTTSNFSRQSNVDIQSNFGYFDEFETVVGAAFQQVQSESNSSGNHNIQQYSAFINQEYRPLAPWLLVAGLRYDKNSSYQRQISPTISSSWQLNHNLAIYVNYGQAYRAPTINDLYWKDPYSSGNPSLAPEKSRQFEFGGRMETGKANFSLAFYQRETSDMIKWFSDPLTYIWTNANLGEVTATGAEISAVIPLWNYFAIDMGYSFCLATVTSDQNRELAYSPANTANLSFAFKDLKVLENLSLGWKFNIQYKDRQLVKHSDLWNSGSELPRYLISGQVLSLKIRDAVLFYKIDNLFNAEYQIREGYPMPRRSYAFGISMELWD